MSDSRFKRERSRSPIGSHRSQSPRKFYDPNEPVYPLYVGNIPVSWTHWTVKQFIKNKLQSKVVADDIRFVKILKSKNGLSSGNCIVEFGDQHNARNAIMQLNGVFCGENKLIVKEDSKKDRSNNHKMHGDEDNSNPNKILSRPRNKANTGPSFNAGKMEEDMTLYGLSMDYIQSLGIKLPLSNRLFIVNLDFKVNEDKLREIFSLAGQVTSVNIHRDKNGTSKGLAQIEYDHPVEAVQAISMFNMQNLYDRQISVRFDNRSTSKTLPEGLKAIGNGLGVNGAPLRGVRNFVELQPLKKLLKQLESNNTSNTESNTQQRGQENLALANQVMNNTMSTPLMNMAGMTNMTNPAGMMNVNLVGLSNPTVGMDLQQNAAESMTAWIPQVQLSSNAVQPSVWTMNQSNNATGMNPLATANVNNQNLQLLQALMQAQSGTQNIAALTGMGNQSVMQNIMGFSQMQSNMNQTPVKPAVEDTNSNTDNTNFTQSSAKMENTQEHRNMSDMVVITNLPPSVTLAILRDKMREVGEVRMAEMTGQDTAIVRFTNPWDAERCVKIFDRSRVDGQTIEVRCV